MLICHIISCVIDVQDIIEEIKKKLDTFESERMIPKELTKLEDLEKELEQIKEIKKKKEEFIDKSLRIKYRQLKVKAEKIKHKDGVPDDEKGKSWLSDIRRELTKAEEKLNHLKQLEEIDFESLLSSIKDIKNKLIKHKNNKTKVTEEDKDIKEIQETAKKQKQKLPESDWDKYYMKIACLAALRSKDPRTPVSYSTLLTGEWPMSHKI